MVDMRALRLLAFGLSLAGAAGCVTRSDEIGPAPIDPAPFAAMDCNALYDEADRVNFRAARVAYAVDERFGTNIVALGVGVSVFWPALLALRPAGPDAEALAQLKGRDEAVRATLSAKGCPPAPEHLSAERAAALPIALGDRLQYSERAKSGGPARELALRVTALRRNGIEFTVEPPGDRPRRWRQDLFGNIPQPPDVADWVHWRRLLQPEMELGTVLSGDIIGPHAQARGRLRGQVVALGVRTSLGRPFDAAVIELFGDVPMNTQSTTRLDGVMVVDRKSGVLLRLELDSANPEFALRRVLDRIEPAVPAASAPQ
jgi:hypothetical protein